MYQLSFKTVELFLSYEVRLRFCDDSVANGITIPRLLCLRKIDTLNMHDPNYWVNISFIVSPITHSNPTMWVLNRVVTAKRFICTQAVNGFPLITTKGVTILLDMGQCMRKRTSCHFWKVLIHTDFPSGQQVKYDEEGCHPVEYLSDSVIELFLWAGHELSSLVIKWSIISRRSRTCTYKISC